MTVVPWALGNDSIIERFLALDGWLQFFFWSNVLILAGYFLMGSKLIWQLPFRKRTAIAGASFFALCGLTHFEMSVHLLLNPNEEWIDIVDSAHMYVIHGLQAISILTFIPFLVLDLRDVVRELVLIFRENTVLRRRLASYEPGIEQVSPKDLPDWILARAEGLNVNEPAE